MKIYKYSKMKFVRSASIKSDLNIDSKKITWKGQRSEHKVSKSSSSVGPGTGPAAWRPVKTRSRPHATR